MLRQMVVAHLHEMNRRVRDALAATARGDWATVLEAVRLIQGGAALTRAALERMIGSGTSAADLPPLVRAVQAVGQLISDREVDTLPPDELRARLRAVLRALEGELRDSLQLDEEASGPYGERSG